MDRYSTMGHERAVVVQSEFIRRVYNWMGLGLVVTAVLALVTASNPAILKAVVGTPLFFVLIIAELGLVIALSAAINRLSAATATMMFFVYSALNGVTLSVIFVAYAKADIANAFFATAGTFGAMSIYGYTTKRDLTEWGSFLMMGLFGVIIGSIVNMFFASTALYWAITYIAVFIFIGLTAYDTQTIKQMAAGGFATEETERKGAVIGALRLYLDFINLFLLFLRIFGRRD